MRTQLITLDIMDQVPEKELISRYGEYGRIVGFQVINSEMPEEQQLLSFDGLTKATFTLHKPDGNLYIEDLDITTYSEDNVAVIALNEQMTAAEGKAHYDITLTYEDDVDGFRIITAHGNMVIDTPMAGTEEINSVSIIYGYIFPDDFQLKLTAGANITISEDNVISSTGGGGGGGEYIAGEGIRISGETISLTTQVLNQLAQIAGKQAQLTAGANININSSNVISATDTTYAAGNNVSISAGNVISATDTTYTAGDGISISEGVITNTAPGVTYTAGDNITIEGTEISATDTTYTAGTNVSISAENVITATDTTYTAGTGLALTSGAFGLDSATQAAVNAVATKQDALTAGANISITGSTISATNTTYTAGSNVQISAGNVISATDTTYTAGANITISPENVISATGGGGGGSYTAGTGIDITSDVISLDAATQSTLADVAGKQDALTAGTNVSISAQNVISATDTTYGVISGGGLRLENGGFGITTTNLAKLTSTENIGAPDTYDPDHKYNLGEACEHNGLWYRSLLGYAGMGPGPWDPTNWERTDSWNEISELNSNLSELVKQTTFSGTTSAQSNLVLAGITTDNIEIISMRGPSNYIAVPWIYNNIWCARVTDSSFQAQPNANVTVTYTYIDKSKIKTV